MHIFYLMKLKSSSHISRVFPCFHHIVNKKNIYILHCKILRTRPRWSRSTVFALRSKVHGFKPSWSRWIFSGLKNPEHKSSGRDFKLGVPSLRFQAWGSLTSLKSQTWDLQLKVPPGGLVLRIFTSWKNPSTSAGFVPANLGSRGKHVTPRPPRPTSHGVN